ncbi:MAG: DNA alkylation repair protein [Jatrophihabitantaceae bacterium]
MPALDADEFIKQLDVHKTAENVKKYEGFFPPERRNGDVFIGVRMRDTFALAKKFKDMPLDEIEKLLESPVHEHRVGAVSIMDFKARDNKTPESVKKDLFDLYLRRHDRINYWDLVDRSAINVVGAYLVDKPRAVLYKLAASKDMWQRRTAIVATIALAANGDPTDTFKIAKLLIDEKEDLIHKATGWALRSAGGQGLIDFLDENGPKLPRVTLRYAIEKFDKETRTKYLKAK